jgi:hypothetical protein
MSRTMAVFACSALPIVADRARSQGPLMPLQKMIATEDRFMIPLESYLKRPIAGPYSRLYHLPENGSRKIICLL